MKIVLILSLIFQLTANAAVDASRSRESNFKRFFRKLNFKPYTPIKQDASTGNPLSQEDSKSITTFDLEKLYKSLESESAMNNFLSNFYEYAKINRKQSRACNRAYKNISSSLKPAISEQQKQSTIENMKVKCDLLTLMDEKADEIEEVIANEENPDGKATDSIKLKMFYSAIDDSENAAIFFLKNFFEKEKIDDKIAKRCENSFKTALTGQREAMGIKRKNYGEEKFSTENKDRIVMLMGEHPRNKLNCDILALMKVEVNEQERIPAGSEIICLVEELPEEHPLPNGIKDVIKVNGEEYQSVEEDIIKDEFSDEKIIGIKLSDGKDGFKEKITKKDLEKFPGNACYISSFEDAFADLDKFRGLVADANKTEIATGQVTDKNLIRKLENKRNKCEWADDNQPLKLTKSSSEISSAASKMESEFFYIGTAVCKSDRKEAKEIMRKIASESNPDESDSFVVYCTSDSATAPSMVNCLKSAPSDEVRALRKAFNIFLLKGEDIEIPRGIL